jgi:hypothetical protein
MINEKLLAPRHFLRTPKMDLAWDQFHMPSIKSYIPQWTLSIKIYYSFYVCRYLCCVYSYPTHLFIIIDSTAPGGPWPS